MSARFLLDANVFIEAKNRYYGFDILPPFWDWLDQKRIDDEISSVLPVYDEIQKGNDNLASWVKDRKGPDWWLPVSDKEFQKEYIEIVSWVMAQDFTEPAKDAFLAGADPWLIAASKALGASCVTHEKMDLLRKSKVLIPVVSRQFNVSTLDTFELIRGFGQPLA